MLHGKYHIDQLPARSQKDGSQLTMDYCERIELLKGGLFRTHMFLTANYDDASSESLTKKRGKAGSVERVAENPTVNSYSRYYSLSDEDTLPVYDKLSEFRLTNCRPNSFRVGVEQHEEVELSFPGR